MTKHFRDNGAIGALLDEYEKAVTELQEILLSISNETLLLNVEKEEASDLFSIQRILSHVLKAGNWYNIEIRKSLGEKLDSPEPEIYNSVSEYCTQLTQLVKSTELIFQEYKEVDIYQHRNFRWKQIVNIDLLLEHAIVHVLRHRRQVEKFILMN